MVYKKYFSVVRVHVGQVRQTMVQHWNDIGSCFLACPAKPLQGFRQVLKQIQFFAGPMLQCRRRWPNIKAAEDTKIKYN